METTKGPSFLEQIRGYYRSRQSNQILLTGNIWDCYNNPFDRENYINLIELLTAFLRDKMCLILFDITKGIKFFDPEEGKICEDFYGQWGTVRSTEQERRRWFIQRLHESMVYPILGLNMLRELCKVVRLYRFHENQDFQLLKLKPLCIIIRYAETILPSGPLERLPESDRQKVTIVRDWFSDRDFVESSELTILISDTYAEVNQKIKDLPHLFSVSIPYPNQEERKRFIRGLYHKYKENITLKESQKALSHLTAGLRFTGIEDIFLGAVHKKDEINRFTVITKVNQVLTKQVGEYIELLKPTHTMRDVLGNSHLKNKLKLLQKRLKSYDPRIVPSGILVSGPNGVGKTFIFAALAAESGRIPVILKNLRSKWFGETDAIFEKINHVLRALGNVLILVDEADTAFGGRGEQSHETEQRLFGNVLKMMSDPANRGKIVWILLTARPDKLEPDFKRPGRCGLHIPVFDPVGKDREEFLKFVLHKVGQTLGELPLDQKNRLNELTVDYSGADFSELSAELSAIKRVAPAEFTIKTIIQFIEDWHPSTISAMRKLQSLHAALHCSYKSLLPPEFRSLDQEKIEAEIRTLTHFK